MGGYNPTKNKAKALWKKVNKPWKKDKKKGKPSIEEEHHHHEEDKEEETKAEEIELSFKDVPEIIVNTPNGPNMPTTSCNNSPYLPPAYLSGGMASSLGHEGCVLPPQYPFPPPAAGLGMANRSGYPPCRPCEEQEDNVM
ncbi:hypothetical protein PIB30_009305 [Stylosanthes scabra]|uniref:Uncharacterized protein n=1 Tax=Stylosanthes scabra TaxID=79078 RepID=A0ABU6T542_9FABA|nr:hypothetical protein [Stylosanthes scabra]